ncbi:glucose-1-phosphate cytidylyltransferase [Flavihumibacter cheonanensis]|uniref:glucose-1-phosphate cytidylyltransferase n=1 Tax=Flavihumibacter cheonanensis TaxID=1442385 RepID=UPI001EF93B8E|nr:glucose-1-phosphate cytidylyltransferase [Flavihumibacter cheonanensis]MCG7751668.1 glucose-1-phosphate cytidylyltransferase [Flavihumibacter cheonanensis]
MKVVIFAGGLGTRISEETETRPKPMVEIGGRPILWHIMKIYESNGFNEFIICLGYKGYVIKEYFMHYYLHNSDITIELKNNKVDVHFTNAESFKVTLVDTGLNTKTAGRLKRIRQYLDNEDFLLTYGDGVADVDLLKLVDFHKSHNKIATVTAVQPEARFGGMTIDPAGVVMNFKEKPTGDGKWINGGFFVLKPSVFEYLADDMDNVMWEDAPMENLTKDGELVAYRHTGFWKCMDALRDKIELENLWESNNALWKRW